MRFGIFLLAGASKNVAISPRFGRMVGVGGMIED